MTDRVPALTADQMREVDRAMIEELHIELVQMMENAGRHLAVLARNLFEPESATILVGKGGNGGGGMVAARHLANAGVRVTVTPVSPDLGPVPQHQLGILERMGVAVAGEPSPADLTIDAVIGYSLRGDPRGRAAELIDWANTFEASVLSLDTPSGLDVTTGHAYTPCVTADATLTLALPKIGLRGAPQVGRLFLADISVPPFLYDRFGIDAVGIFAEGAIVDLS